ncbi:OmpA family protein [methane-oxidizing endosymbiont of Gigantopelta aegis]|uniref:OmpA family protein n=1 Tax=methane-oxidizing endosymbiont of Gigantopelta aegis TaxID=2794938 RepID=UPI001FD93911|nr:OmpA family protein [methane-oxidizing endosymbiont of Gigantopelta aegis]
MFAFFVVMYSIAQLNNTKYDSLVEALEDAFTSKKQKPITAEQPIPAEDSVTVIQPIKLDDPTDEEKRKRQRLSDEILHERRILAKASENLHAVLEPYIKDDLVSVKRNDFWLELEMKSDLLFLSGEAELSKKASPVLRKIAEVLGRMPNMINVEGHTDNIPIDTVEFPSNWDLSAARATSVVRELIKDHINPKRLAVVGYGEFHPVADNSTEEGRFKNRRVLLVVMSQAFARYGASDEERARLLNYKR